MDFAPEGPMAIPMWVNGRAYLSVGDRFFNVVNPVSGEAVRRVPLCGAAEAAEAVTAAQAAQPQWAAMGMPARRVCIQALADGLERYRGHFAKLLQQDLGLADEAAGAEVDAALAALRSDVVGQAGFVSGVFGLVVGAEQPLSRFAAAIAPLLLAGGTLTVKPSPQAPSAIFALCELSSRCDWPGGVVNLVQGDKDAIDGLCRAGIERLLFTGEAGLGAQVAALADAAGIACDLLA